MSVVPLMVVLLSPREAPLAVRASDAAAPCVRAAAESYERAAGRRVTVEAGSLRNAGPADVLVGFGVEMTRAVEGGDAVDGSEVDVARIPWVLAVPAGNPRNLRALGDLAQPGLDVWVLGGPAAYEARRALGSLAPERVKEATDATLLQAAPVALVPLSLAGSAEKIPVDVPPLVARAAVAARSARAEAAREFVKFLGSQAGQRAFTSCGSR